MQWSSRINTADQDVRKVELLRSGRRARFSEVIGHWRFDRDFRDYFITLLASAPFEAYFWETPPIARACRSRAFEFVLTDSPALAGLQPDPTAFARQFKAAGVETEATAFWNLGGDAVLIAPCPHAPNKVYPHIAVFSREAPLAQQHAFWQLVGDRVSDSLSERPLWLSTSGLGVAWLHVRLDSWPKYYTHQPYRATT